MNVINAFLDAWNSTTDHYALRTKRSPKSSSAQTSFVWDESLHPRAAKGAAQSHGGEFVKVNSSVRGASKSERSPEQIVLGKRAGDSKVLGAMLYQEIKTKGHVSLLGQSVRSAEELAAVAQVYRDPRFETFRAFIVKDGKIVSHNAYTSRNPGAVILPQTIAIQLAIDLKLSGGDGYYLMHNHPSGNPQPSGADLHMTKAFAKVVPGMIDHVIIDHNRGAVINADGVARYYDKENENLQDVSKATVPNEYLGTKITSSESLGSLAMRLNPQEDRAVMIFASPHLEVRMLLDVNTGNLKRADAKLIAAVRRAARASNATRQFLVLPKGAKPRDYAHLMRAGLVLDIIASDGRSAAMEGTASGADPIEAKLKSRRTVREQLQYALADEFASIILDHYALRAQKAIKSSSLQSGFNWDESEHPRAPKGADGSLGGRFVRKEEISAKHAALVAGGVKHETSRSILDGVKKYLEAGGIPRYRGEDTDQLQGLAQIAGHEAAVDRTNAILGREPKWLIEPTVVADDRDQAEDPNSDDTPIANHRGSSRFANAKTVGDIRKLLKNGETLVFAKYGGGEQFEVRKRLSPGSQFNGGQSRGIVATFEKLAKTATDGAKSGIEKPTKTNAHAMPGDQLGLFGEASKPKSEGPAALALKPGEATKGKAQNLFDTHGNADQMDLFGDGVMPSDLVNKDYKGEPASGASPKKPFVYPNGQTQAFEETGKPVAVTPVEQASQAFESAIEDDKSPREAAEAAQKKLDEDYEFARSSEVRNAGEDLKGSARHKVNQWKTLADAEKDGTAAEMITRDQLLKNEPPELMSHVERSPLTSLAMHYAMRKFPGKPTANRSPLTGDPTKNRKEFYEAYASIKSKAESLAEAHDDPLKATEELQKHVRDTIEKLRSQRIPNTHGTGEVTDRYNQTANDLVSMHKALGRYRAPKTAVAALINEFSMAAQERYGNDWKESPEVAEHARDIMEGQSFNATFDRDKKDVNRFNPSEMYVKVASRSGGRDLNQLTSDPVKATRHLVDAFGMRGVQWGNSVTDDERKHHAAKTVEALTDLADTLGLHPKDIALDGKLGLAIGARGRSGAVAHYEPDSKVINLTRANGVGSLAHEWAHGFDHFLNDFGKSFASHDTDTHEFTDPNMPGRTWKTSRPEAAKFREVKERKYSGVRKAMQDLHEAQRSYRRRLGDLLKEKVNRKEMSPAKANGYWDSNLEVFARTFERHVQRKLEREGKKNTYLAGYEGKSHKFGGLWPTDEETDSMSDAFDKVFEAYRKEKHGSAEKVRFSRREARDTFKAIFLESGAC